MNFKPLHDRILVKRVAQESSTLSGIIIPDSAKEKPITGLVLAVGAGKTDDAGNVRTLDVAAGDTVLFGKYAGTEIKIEGLEHTILREDDVLGIVES
jgi:chaperonin GroES